ncbi:NUDIX hydrolase [Pontibacter sp. 172403-2]|uniref:NUDIX domain-containing protein n=1 Tax=Pontibacter rufus TaxID=2791028 RepID=UPI0018AFCC41|nr:NUDIX hydrolase [Pontibacter sp. 172403-2]MBF9254295.1 NUDIX hydrolase [Pontibacter sp. 172403-2]
MPDLNPNAAAYANKLRVRVCGVCLQEDKLLLVRHDRTLNNNAFWAPPGGGVNFGETLQQALVREMLEETGLQVTVGRYLFVNEFVEPPLHAVEFFFEVSLTGGSIITGTDPELAADRQLIRQVQWLKIKELQAIPTSDKHRALQHLFSLDDLLGLPDHFGR